MEKVGMEYKDYYKVLGVKREASAAILNGRIKNSLENIILMSIRKKTQRSVLKK